MSAPLPRPLGWRGAVLARSTNVLSRRVEAGLVLASPSVEHAVVLADSAAMLWEALAEPRPGEAVLDDLSSRYGLTPESIAGDVETALHELLALGLIELV